MGPKEQRREELLNVNSEMPGCPSSYLMMAILVLKDTERFEHRHEITLKFIYTKKKIGRKERVEWPQRRGCPINPRVSHLTPQLCMTRAYRLWSLT